MYIRGFGARNIYPIHKEPFSSAKRQPLAEGLPVKLAEAKRLHGRMETYFDEMPRKDVDAKQALSDAQRAIEAWNAAMPLLQKGSPEKGEAYIALAELYDMKNKLIMSTYDHSGSARSQNLLAEEAYKSAVLAWGYAKKAFLHAKKTGAATMDIEHREICLLHIGEAFAQGYYGVIRNRSLRPKYRTPETVREFEKAGKEVSRLRGKYYEVPVPRTPDIGAQG